MANEDKTVSNSTTITFISEASLEDDMATIVVELDDEKNEEVYGEEKTQFLYGETAYFRIYKYPPEMSIQITASDGAVTDHTSGTSTEEEDVTFANTNEGSLSKPSKDTSISANWLGNSLGSITAIGTELTTSQKGVAVARVNYSADYTQHSITLDAKEGFDEYPVVVFVLGE